MLVLHEFQVATQISQIQQQSLNEHVLDLYDDLPQLVLHQRNTVEMMLSMRNLERLVMTEKMAMMKMAVPIHVKYRHVVMVSSITADQ